MVEVVVHTMVQDAAKQMVVVLKEREGPRALPIVIGNYEAQAILLELRGFEPARPLTHDLLRSVLDELGVQLARVVVHDMRDNIYYAILVLVNNGTEQEVDARPSDAIALALRVGAPIYVGDKLMEEATVSLEDYEEPEAEQDPAKASEIDRCFRDIISDLDLEDYS